MLQKQVLNINFAQGLDTKTDPFQVQAGKFLSLQNSIFDKAGRLTKRNGYGPLASLPVTTTAFLTTFNGNLTALGKQLYAFSEGTQSWVNKGNIQPISLNTLSAVRSSTNQSQSDSITAANGLTCVVYTDDLPAGTAYKYAILDSVTGQDIVAPTLIPAQAGGTVTGSPRVFLLGSSFVIVYTNVITATSHLEFAAISTGSPTNAPILGEIASSYVSATTLSWDAIVYGNSLYVGYNSTTGGQNISFRTISSNTLVVSGAVTFPGEVCTMMSMTVDATNTSVPTIWAAYYDLASTTGKVLALGAGMGTILAPTTTISSGTYLNVTCVAQNGILTEFLEHANNYSYDSSIPTHFIQSITVTQAGVVGSLGVVARSVGLASKAFLFNTIPYFLSVYVSPFQPSYFLLNGLTGKVISKLAYSNGGPYDVKGLPGITLAGSVASVSYLFKDLLQASHISSTQSTSPNVYSQTGINIASFNFQAAQITSGEIGSNLNFSGGFVTSYDGFVPVEQGFFVWPDSVEAAFSTTGGAMAAQPDGSTNTNAYFYQVTYEWTDNQGNLFRSAPSIPVGVTTTGSGTTGSITLNIPTLRLTYKSNVAIVIYRWSVAQEIYYQVTSITSPTLNDPTVDSITYVDTLADASIAGNNIIYTTGGVLEDISPPATDLITLFNNRLWLVDSEDRNLLWYSKQVIEATPVEMSDLLTIYVAPTTASEGSTGPITAIAPMDDKLIIFKGNALGYINGIGPDNTGANSSYSDFILINSVVGCTNQNSIVFTPQGLMFQSNKGIWLLGRDLSTNYIGAPVELLTTGALVESALNIPATNQVRFTLDSGITLLYDYFFAQWGTFINIPAVSSTVYQSLHTYVNSRGQVFQETPGTYLDNTSPVLMSFTTSWLNLAGVQGFERFNQLYLLGQYISPFKLNMQIAYDYNPNPQQSTIVTPSQVPITWGSDALWGSGAVWGSQGSTPGWEGQANVFEARVFPQRQKCETFQIIMNEIYDASVGGTPGAGLTLSGLDIVVGIKRGFRTGKASRNFG